MWKALAVIVFLVLAGCGKQDEKFLGTWRNPGDIALTVTRNGDSLLVQESFVSKNAIYRTRQARANGNVLELDEGTYFNRFIHVEADDTLVSTGAGITVTFRRVN